ncbi:exported hypothetical protein [Candidatus Terasakiella magnetica]|uniref:Uncharacterized protein n=1 Tax=Candidatus Terasakiella magnetica TaxID=1867952 RepID=A0A1C3RHK1_9PROT|nr:hypothetical protein [Candidatus Terasakiella magnetica]SCA56753.1 exported hypothetical protein [Candidatus Terasakiella magnetica]
MSRTHKPKPSVVNMGTLAMGGGCVLASTVAPVACVIPVAMWAATMLDRPSKKGKGNFSMPAKRRKKLL